MKGSECKFVQYMQGSDKRFIIPVYQRNYDWKQENCRQLYDDLVKVIKGNRKSHFFGSLVSVFSPDGYGMNLLVIDGQQRLTTVSLLLLAMYNLIEQGEITPENPTLKQRILEEYLIDKWKPKDTRIKLKPIKKDREAFGNLFSDPKKYIPESNLTVNYEYFYDRIKLREITIDQLYDAICCLEIINIQLEPDDNPQLIFESLNSTGLDLSEGDKIRNFILMNLTPEEQEDYYTNYWTEIELCTKYDVSAFMRDFLSVKQRDIPKQNKVYISFKEFVESEKIETKTLLEEMLEYAQRYKILLDGYSEGKNDNIPEKNALNACIYRINRLETTVTRPYFLEVLRLFGEKKLTLRQVADIFLIVESYLFRRTICDLPTNALNKIFLMLHREIVRYDGTEDNYVEKLKYALQIKKENARFPDNEEFTTAFTERQVYFMSGKNKLYILERFENGNIDEDKAIYHLCDDNVYSIEHVMPQHLTPEWQKELGEDYETIHEQWLHRIANLTLTAYNSEYSNRPFTEKKTMDKGFLKSGLRLNAWIGRQTKWTLAELELRNEFLMREAVSIWAKPTTDYKPAEKPLVACTLEDDADLTGRSISSFSFQKAEQPVTSWADMYQKVLQMLYTEHQASIRQLAETKNEKDLALHFSADPKEFAKSEEIASGIYVWMGGPIKSKLSVLRRLFKLLHEDPEDLVFFLQDKDPGVEDFLYTLRRKYWTYALPIIQQAHGEEGSFSNVSPSTHNTIRGWFGVRGFCLSCAANMDSARVKLELSKDKREENKQAFDRLAAHRAEIEAALGTALKWNRGDDMISSIVSVTMNDVSISNEKDWPRMAKYQADWSKKFLDVLVPYIKAV